MRIHTRGRGAQQALPQQAHRMDAMHKMGRNPHEHASSKATLPAPESDLKGGRPDSIW